MIQIHQIQFCVKNVYKQYKNFLMNNKEKFKKSPSGSLYKILKYDNNHNPTKWVIKCAKCGKFYTVSYSYSIHKAQGDYFYCTKCLPLESIYLF